jgi:diketogulonate reductase-like aldo/keto reductase
MCCRPSAYDPETVRRTIVWYLLKGGRHIDTAQLYLNHRPIGEGIKEAIKRGVPRKEIFVTTKVFPRSYGDNATTTAVHGFLEELGLEYIDLVLLHMPKSFGFPDVCPAGSHEACRHEAWLALSRLRDQGLVKEIGVSNFNSKQLKQIQDLKAAPIAANQIMYNPWVPDWQQETFEYCQKNNIVVTAYSSLGMFFQKALTETVETLQRVAKSNDKTLQQVLLRWALQKGASIIPGTGNPKHMVENLAVSSFTLSAKDMEDIDALRSDPQAKEFMYNEMSDDR